MAIEGSPTWEKSKSYNHSEISSIEIPGLTQDGQRVKVNAKTLDKIKLVIVMVGLPARGKSYISRKLARYLNWLQYETRIFNAGQTRRNHEPKEEQEITSKPPKISHPATFFDPDNPTAVAARNEIAIHTLNELLLWLQRRKSCIGILDATNSTIHRRRVILDHIRNTVGLGVEVFFLESACNDQELLQQNINLKLSGPDYKHRDKKASLIDFQQRVRNYEKSYTPMGHNPSEANFPYLQLINLGKRVVANSIDGFLSAQIMEYLLNLRLHERQIWITRNGESIDDANAIIGRSSELTLKGTRFASALTKFVNEQSIAWDHKKQLQHENENGCSKNGNHINSHQSQSDMPPINPKYHIWTSMMQQAVETSQFFTGNQYKVKHLRMLNDLHAGNMEGLTFKQIHSEHHDEMIERQKNPVFYRWPGTGGESYADVINRLRPIIIELERMKDHVLLITHRAVARVLLAYFQEMNWDEIAEVDVPPGRIFSVEPMPYGVTVESYQYDEVNEQFHHLKH